MSVIIELGDFDEWIEYVFDFSASSLIWAAFKNDSNGSGTGIGTGNGTMIGHGTNKVIGCCDGGGGGGALWKALNMGDC